MNLLRRFQFNLRYFGSPPWDSGITPPELFEFIRSHPAGRALDIGCGTGTNVITLAKTGWQVTGFDFAPRAIRIAQRKIKKAGAQAALFTDDATRMKKITGKFDLALDMGCFHNLENKVDYLNQLDRVLAPHGFWLMYGFLNQTEDPAAPGMADSDLGLISARAFTLLSRQNGFDQGSRPSAWFLYQKEGQANR
jgi:ubiquinone/menaquinone biosynthesis C-methylase UbiE